VADAVWVEEELAVVLADAVREPAVCSRSAALRGGSRRCRRRLVAAVPFPARAAVDGAVEPRLVVDRLDQGVDGGGAGASLDGEAGPAEVASGQAVAKLRPGPAGVRRLEDPALGAAAYGLADVAPARVRRGVQHIGIVGVEDDVGDAGILADGQHRIPGSTTIGRLVQAALAARGEERALCGDIHHVGVTRVDLDGTNVLRPLQSHAPPRRAGVRGLVYAVAEVRAALAVVLAGAEPEHVGVAGVDDDAAEVVRAAFVEDRRERQAAVRRLPHATEGRCDVPGARVVRVDGNVGYAARHQPRAQCADLDARERFSIEAGLLRGGRQRQQQHRDRGPAGERRRSHPWVSIEGTARPERRHAAPCGGPAERYVAARAPVKHPRCARRHRASDGRGRRSTRSVRCGRQLLIFAECNEYL
jgi:hypothetical protein